VSWNATRRVVNRPAALEDAVWNVKEKYVSKFARKETASSNALKMQKCASRIVASLIIAKKNI